MTTTAITDTMSRMDMDLNKKLETRHERFIAEVRLQAIQDALSFCPPESARSLLPYIDHIHCNYNMLMLEVKSELAPDLQVKLGAVDMDTITRENTEDEKEIAQRRHENDLQKQYFRNKPVWWPIIGLFFGIIFSLCIAIGEGNYISSSLQAKQPSYLASIIGAVAISFGLFALTHLGPSFIRAKFSSIYVRRTLIFLLIGVVILLFISLGHIRAEYISRMEGTQTSMWDFVFWSSVLYLGLFLCAEKIIIPLLPIVKESFNTLIKRRAIRRESASIKQLEILVKESRNGLTDSLKNRLTLINSAKSAEQLINSMYHKAIATYKSSNLAKRVDGVRPACFNDTPPALDTITDITIN